MATAAIQHLHNKCFKIEQQLSRTIQNQLENEYSMLVKYPSTFLRYHEQLFRLVEKMKIESLSLFDTKIFNDDDHLDKATISHLKCVILMRKCCEIFGNLFDTYTLLFHENVLNDKQQTEVNKMFDIDQYLFQKLKQLRETYCRLFEILEVYSY